MSCKGPGLAFRSLLASWGSQVVTEVLGRGEGRRRKEARVGPRNPVNGAGLGRERGFGGGAG